MSATLQTDLVPPADVETPCLIIDHQAVRDNLAAVLQLCGGADRLVPHIKTHRAPWLVADLVELGLKAFKVATPAEMEIVLAAGAKEAIWAYPSLNVAAIDRVIAAARAHPAARVSALVHNVAGLETWHRCLGSARPAPVRLRVDLDTGMHRTGLAMGEDAASLARRLADAELFSGWHAYDGHITDADIKHRRERVAAVADSLFDFIEQSHPGADTPDLIVGGSYTFDLWPQRPGLRVSPGSWVYSSMRHGIDLPHLGWRQAAFVLATVIRCDGSDTTLDAGAKAIGADMILAERFAWPGKIKLMSEEHSVVEGDRHGAGDRVLLTPGHACTTAYLYPVAWVLSLDGTWEQREQLGSRR